MNHVKLAIRAYVEHVFGCMTMSMGGKLTGKIGLATRQLSRQRGLGVGWNFITPSAMLSKFGKTDHLLGLSLARPKISSLTRVLL
jgi:hypothetical protein